MPAPDRFDRTLAHTRVSYVAKAAPDPTAVTVDRKTALNDVGGSGLKQSSGLVMEEFDRNLKGTKANKIYEEMGATPIAGAVLLLITQWMRGATWTVVPFEADIPEYDDDALFVEQCLEDMSTTWSSVVDEISTEVQFGWSWCHVVYKVRNGIQDSPGDSSKYSDGRLGWRKFSFKSQDSLQRWEFDDDGGIVGWWQRTQDKGVAFLPIAQGLLFRTTARKGNPQGRSMLRSAYEPWWKKKRLEEIEGIGHERNLAGMPVIYVDPEVLDNPEFSAQKEVYEKLVKDIRIDEQMGAVLPMAYAEDAQGNPTSNPLYKLELLASPGTARIDIGATISRYAREIAMSVLADVILLGHEHAGLGNSTALAVTKDEMLRRSLMGLLTDVADVFNRHEIPRLFRLNGKVTGELPSLAVAPPESTTAEQIITMLAELASTGAVLWPSAELAEYVEQKTGIPMTDIEEETPTPAPPAPTPPEPPEPDPNGPPPEPMPNPDDVPEDPADGGN